MGESFWHETAPLPMCETESTCTAPLPADHFPRPSQQGRTMPALGRAAGILGVLCVCCIVTATATPHTVHAPHLEGDTGATRTSGSVQHGNSTPPPWNASKWSLVMLTDAAKTGAVCLDGSPGGYYIRPGLPNNSRWVVFHQVCLPSLFCATILLLFFAPCLWHHHTPLLLSGCFGIVGTVMA
jgi:hypothetical protein